MPRISTCLFLAIASAAAACTATPEPAVRLELLGAGIIEKTATTWREDPSSTVGAKRADARALRIVEQTQVIPLQPGLSYGIAFRITKAPQQVVRLRAVLQTSAPCKLKSTGEVVHHNDSMLTVRVGDVRHLAATIPATPDENHCEGEPQPGIDTFAIYAEGEKLVETRFQVHRREP